MAHHILKRLASSIVVLFVVVTATFFLIQWAPGGLSILMDPNLSAEEAARVARNLGLDQPAHVQYWRWLTQLVKGDLGRSLSYGGRSVLEMVVERLPATILLGGASALLTLVLGVPMGMYAARKHNTAVDRLINFFSAIALAAPGFWLGIMAIIVFSVELDWLPSAGISTIGAPFSLLDRLAHLVMPAVVLATANLAQIVRYTRSSWLETLRMQYVLVARSKGLSEMTVDYKHILRNALIPVITVFGVSLPRLIGGSAITETLFSWPGIGQLAVDAALRRDTPLVLGVTLFVSAAVIVSNLVIDLLYPLIDRRIRYE